MDLSNFSKEAAANAQVLPLGVWGLRKVDIRLPGKRNPNSHSARPVHQIISMMKWIRTSGLAVKNSLSSFLGFGVWGLGYPSSGDEVEFDPEEVLGRS